MSIRAIPRAAIGGSITLVRLPLEIAVSLVPGKGAGPASTTGITLDRIEANLRDYAGIALGDEVLREDAALRRAAADERERALNLRANASSRVAEADQRLDDTRDAAAEKRAQAAETARRRRAAAASERKQRTQQASTAERRRRSTSATVKAKTDERIADDAADARLAQLAREAAALDEKANALTAEAEAQRLQDEATKKKAARKKR